jgi:hypothetical protein
MNLLEKLTKDQIISKYLSYYTKHEQIDAIQSTLVYGICQLKLHYNNPLPLTLLNETLRKAKTLYNCSTAASSIMPSNDTAIRAS